MNSWKHSGFSGGVHPYTESPVHICRERCLTGDFSGGMVSFFRLIEPSPNGTGQPLSVIDCALFAGSRPLVIRSFARAGEVFQLSEGMTLRIQGRITLWDKGGRYQLIVEQIDPSWTMENR